VTAAANWLTGGAAAAKKEAFQEPEDKEKCGITTVPIDIFAGCQPDLNNRFINSTTAMNTRLAEERLPPPPAPG
jgi:hypothetical protein